MRIPVRFRRSSTLVAVLLAASLLSCGREITGPGGARWSGSLALAPHFEAPTPVAGGDVDNVAAIVPFTRVRVIVQRRGATILSRIANFGASTDTVALGLTVPLTSNNGDTLQLLLRYINAAGDTVFSGGPISVTVFPGQPANPTAVEMPVTYVGPGASAVSVSVAPDSILATTGQLASLTAVALNGQEAVVSNAVVGFISRDLTKVVIPNIAVGSAQIVGARGSTYVVAQLIGGAKDSTKITIDPRPSALTLVSGNNQAALQGTAFALPLRVRATAIDGLGVAGWPVNFAVSNGQGSLDSTVVHTDSLGFAQVLWTAGDSAGAAVVIASISAPALSVVFSGTQQSSAPSSLTFATQPNSITAGDPIDTVRVEVRNGAGGVITTFNGSVTVALVNGTVGAQLLGAATVNAVNGVAKFGGLTVDRQGNNYRLSATTAGVGATVTNPFNVAAAPASQVTLFSGGGQSAAAGAPLADSIVVRVLDQFGFPVAGVTVNFAVTQGGGGISPVSGVSSAGGFVATQWTLGTAGPQQVTATAGALTPLAINATLVAGGPTVLFAGHDYTYVPAGQSRTVPIFLSSPSASPITVTLAMQFDSIATFDSASVVFVPGATRIDVPLTAGVPGQTWAHFSSTAGDDSLFVFVDSATVNFADLDWSQFTLGDTIRTIVILSDPAPAGGVNVKVKSLNPALALVAASDGEGAPVPACLSPVYCSEGDARAEYSQWAPAGGAALLGPLGDSATVFIPAGQKVGHVAAVIIALGGDGPETVNFETTAPGFVGDFDGITVDTLIVSASSAHSALSTPFGIGQVHRVYLYNPNGAVVREHRFALSSANPAIATVDTSTSFERFEHFTPPFAVYGVAAGSTFIRYGFAGAAPTDSFEVTVGAPALHADANGSTFGQNESVYLYVSTSGPSGFDFFERSAPLSVSAHSTDTSVVRLMITSATVDPGEESTYLLFRIVGPGSASIVVEAAGHTPDTVPIATFQQPLTLYSGLQRVGVGQYEAVSVRVPGGLYAFTETQQVTVTSLNPGIVQVLTPSIHVGLETVAAEAVYAGISAGIDTLRFSTPGHPDLDLEITVLPTELLLSTVFPVIDPDSVEFDIAAYVSDGVYTHDMMDTVYAVLRSSDPSVVEVTDSLVIIAAGADGGSGKFRGLQPGSATLTLHANGDSSNAFPITVVPFQLSVSTSSGVVGIDTREFAALARNSPSAGILDYTVTQTGPGAVLFHELVDSFPAGDAVLNFSIVGVTAGVDTITFSAPGHADATLVVTVDSVQLSLGDVLSEVVAGFRDEFVYGYLRISESPVPRRAHTQMKFVVRSLDTLLASVDQDTVIFEPGDVYPNVLAKVRYRDFGTADIVIEDPAGAVRSDTLGVSISPRELFGYTAYGDNQLVLGMGQKADDFEVAVERGYYSADSLWVHLKASADGLIAIPDSVLIEPWEYGAAIPVIALDTVGSVRVEASVRGYNPWQFDVTVTRTVAEPWFDDTFVGGRGFAEVYLVDALTRFARPTATVVPLRFTTTMPGIVDTGIGTFNSDTSEFYTLVQGPIGVSVGRTNVTVEDARVASFGQFASGSAELEVRQPRLELYRELYQVGLGLTSISSSLGFNADAARDSIVVRFTTATGRARAAPDSLLLIRALIEPEVSAAAFSISETFTLTGDSLGVDTLTLSADGFSADFGVIRVEPGMLVLANEPALTIVSGDSTFVTLSLRDPGGGLAMAADVLQLTFATDTNFVVSNGTTAVGTLNIPAGATTVSFWVKSVGSGDTELVVTSPNFRTFRLRFTTRPIPG